MTPEEVMFAERIIADAGAAVVPQAQLVKALKRPGHRGHDERRGFDVSGSG